MDNIRQIRVLVPPVVFVLSLLIAARIEGDHQNAIRTIVSEAIPVGGSLGGLLGLVAASGAVVICGWCDNRWNYQYIS